MSSQWLGIVHVMMNLLEGLSEMQCFQMALEEVELCGELRLCVECLQINTHFRTSVELLTRCIDCLSCQSILSEDYISWWAAKAFCLQYFDSKGVRDPEKFCSTNHERFHRCACAKLWCL